MPSDGDSHYRAGHAPPVRTPPGPRPPISPRPPLSDSPRAPLGGRVSTVEAIEGRAWPDPGPDATYLVRRCNELRRKPVAEFTVEDLRIMLGQQIGTAVLLPRALGILLTDPLAEGDFFPGDLLGAVLRLPDPAWSGLNAQRRRLLRVLRGLLPRPGVDRNLRAEILRFVARH